MNLMRYAKSGQLPASIGQTTLLYFDLLYTLCFFQKGVQFRLVALSFFVFFLAFS